MKIELTPTYSFKQLGRYLSQFDWDNPFTVDDLAKAIAFAYDAIDAAKDQTSSNMATTMTLLVFHCDGLLIAHIGDSRIYQFRLGQGIIHRTEDHSLVQELVTAGVLTEEQARNHPQNNIITRSMSAREDRSPADVFISNDILAGDVFLLCTDGVLHALDDEQLTQLMLSHSNDEDKMKQLALNCADSSDNNTAIMMRVINADGFVAEKYSNLYLDISPYTTPKLTNIFKKIITSISKTLNW